MFCCLLEIKDPEGFVRENMLKRMVGRCLGPANQTIRLSRELTLVITSLESYAEVKEKLALIYKRTKAQYGPSFELKCGFAEVKNSDILAAVEAARQLLARTNGAPAISGMYYYRFKPFGLAPTDGL